MTIRLIHSNDVTNNRADIATRYTDIFFDDEANSILLPDPSGILETKIGTVGIKSATITNGNLIITKTDNTTIDAGRVVANATSTTTTTTTAGGPPVVGSAPNPFAPIVVTAPPGYKAANLDDGVELTLDTLSVQLATSGSRSLQFRVTSGTMTVNIAGHCYWANGSYGGNFGANYWNGNTLNTTWVQPIGWSFPWANDMAVYNVQDQTNRRFYRITLIIGPGYKKNTIVMERLV